MEIILPTLGEERQKTYSPFLPVCPRTGRVLQVPMVARNVEAGTISYEDPDGERVETPVTGGRVKCQWKADWALRWAALGVDYEMAGKDLIDSRHAVLEDLPRAGARPPEGFNYELFLDENGEKISKSKGNGLTIDEWLTYASTESLSMYMFQKPRAARKLYFDVIPKTVDEYLTFLAKYPDQTPKEKVGNPVWHIHLGDPPRVEVPISFSLLLNLVSASNADNKDTLWGFIGRYAPGHAGNAPELDRMVGYAINYYRDFVAPAKSFRAPDERERAAITELYERLGELAEGHGRRGHSGGGLRDRQDARIRPAARLVPRALRGAARPERRPALRLVRRALRHRKHPRDDRRAAAGHDELASPVHSRRDGSASRVSRANRCRASSSGSVWHSFPDTR